MEYMNDPNQKVPAREARGLNVNDITGKAAQGHVSERMAPIRPKVMEYDIINPGPRDSTTLRLSQVGKTVLESRGKARRDPLGSPVAGVPKKIV